ncbi:MAG: hypothetical protein KAT90_06165 [Gammaproteobacteria bacterium]|nr:hypothetical protein [Gammaproteobacteria bacterium]
MEFLYRGVNANLYQKLNGKILPKPEKAGQQFHSYVCAGAPHAVCGSGIVAGESVRNTVILHQWGQKGHPTSGVSSSPKKERAKFYALGDGNTKGYIYTLSVNSLRKEGVMIYKVSEHATNPAVPEDDEHILVASDFGEIPTMAIVSIESVENGI